MSGLDLLTLIIILAFIARGLHRGFIKEIFSTIGLFGGLYIAVLYTRKLVYYLTPYIPSQFLSYIIAFFITFLMVYIVIMLIGDVLAKLIRVLMLGFIDSFLGGVLGFIEGFFIAGAILLIVYKAFPGGVNTVEYGWITGKVYHRFYSVFGSTWEKGERQLKEKIEKLQKTVPEGEQNDHI